MGESQNGCFKKTKHVKCSKSKHFLSPDTHTYVCVSGGKKCSFFGKFDVLCFPEKPVSRFTLCLITDELLNKQNEATNLDRLQKMEFNVKIHCQKTLCLSPVKENRPSYHSYS